MLKSIDELIKTAVDEVEQDNLHRLAPYLRVEIYKNLQATNNNQFLWLQYVTVEHVLPLAEQVETEYEPSFLVDLLKNLILGKDNAATAKAILDEIWNVRFKEDREGLPEAEFRSMNAYDAILYSLGWVVESPTYPDFTKDDADNHWLNDSTDAAMWAAIAYAGVNWYKFYEADKGREFWLWWLTKAIPQAGELAKLTSDDKISS